MEKRIKLLLEDKVAIVSGGAKGLGKGIAVKFAEEGCSVAIADISKKEADDVIDEIKKAGGDGLALQCDVTDIDQVKDTVQQVIEKYGKIDILVNNAGGIAAHTPVEDLTEEVWDKVFALNLKSHFFFCKFVVPHMKERKYGKIIGLSSIGAIVPPAHEVHYNSAKSGIIGFTYDLANALAPLNIYVNVILPGPIETSFYDSRISSKTEKEREEFFRYLGTKVPLQKVGKPEYIAGAALFLASELSDFVTGQAINVAGGLPLQPPRPNP